MVWHAGLSGSIPLALATPGEEALLKATGGAVSEAIPISTTILSPWNLVICAIILVGLPLINAMMHPAPQDTVTIDPALLIEEEEVYEEAKTPAQKMEHSILGSALVTIIGLVFLVTYFAAKGLNGLNLNTVNCIFLILGIAFHKTPIAYVRAITKAAEGAAGIILQFPFYAGIMGMMTFTGPDGHSLAGVISEFFVSISNQITFPVFTFLAAGIVNLFVPSGGGQWAVQGPIMMPAGLELGVTPNITGMAIAWGDAWTNMIQPFWALPALGIAGLSARDIMGYCLMTLFFAGIVVCGGFIVVGLTAG